MSYETMTMASQIATITATSATATLTCLMGLEVAIGTSGR
jgi:hypothetical protein